MMGTSETTSSSGTTRWLIPAAAAVIGVGYLIAGVVGDNLGFGVFGLGLMLAVGLAFVVLSRRSETVSGLLDRRDERINTIDRDATLFAGALTLLVVIALFMIEIARGQDGAPYYQLGAVGGVGYVAALVFLRFRR